MTRTLLILYFVVTMGVGPRVCCVAGDMMDVSAKMLVAAPTHQNCCAKPLTLPNKAGQPDHVPGRCHNLQREGIEAVKTVPPTHDEVAIVTQTSCSCEIVAEVIRENVFAGAEARDKLSLLQILRC